MSDDHNLPGEAPTESPEEIYERLMIEAGEALVATEALALAAELLDTTQELGRRDGLQLVIDLLSRVDRDGLDPLASVQVDFCLGDAWGALDAIARRQGTTEAFWETEYLAKRLLHLRLAVRGFDAIAEVPEEYACSVLNNLGTALNSTGRLLPAILVWDEAIARNPEFAMALGNRGCALVEYGRAVHDESHALLLWKRAWLDLGAALKKLPHPEAAEGFRQYLAFIEKVLPGESLTDALDWNQLPLGISNEESAYRQWCLDERLFLHPLNDLGPITLGAYDPISTPNMILGPGEGEYYQGFFNELKQEFVSARYLLFEGLAAKAPHFSDRDVTIADTLDQPVYSLASQKLRLAFRSASSLFDKAAVFLNYYLALEIPERQVTFRTIWYTKQDRTRRIRSEFRDRENAWLRALFALSLDTFDNAAGFPDVSEPDAKTLYEVRNYAEHKFLKLHSSDHWRVLVPATPNQSVPQPLSLTRQDFAEKTMKVMRTARELLIYLSLMIREEERCRFKAGGMMAVPLPWLEFGSDRKL